MNRFPLRAALIAAALGALALAVGACGSSEGEAPADATAMSF